MPEQPPFFELIKTDSATKARVGVLHTDHGPVETPIFMPVGSLGMVKAIEPRELRDLGAQIILGNTYHLHLKPGTEILQQAGGLHRFNTWSKPILTDSGGFQVFSLRDTRKISEQGVTFKSHFDGSRHFFSPERAIEIQRLIGSDIMMVLDECVANPCPYDDAKASMELTLRWALRNKEAFDNSSPLYGHRQFLFGIGQGSVYRDLREQCMQELVGMNFDGYAIGGLAVGEEASVMYEVTDYSTEHMPHDKPRYLMGVGTPENVLNCIERGVDMFDCVMPTRNARNGTLFTTWGKINAKAGKFKNHHAPIDPGLDAFGSQNYSLAFLRHLLNAGEILGLQIATLQNIAYYMWLVRTARQHLLNGTFLQWKHDILTRTA